MPTNQEPGCAKEAGARHGMPVAARPRKRSNEACPAAYRNRPARLRAAIYRVWELANDLAFSRATTRVAQAILASGVSVSEPLDAVFTKKRTLARLAQCSEVTVYRALRRLETDHLIVRDQQERTADGMLDIGYIRLTQKFACRLGLLEPGTNIRDARFINNHDQDGGGRAGNISPEPTLPSPPLCETGHAIGSGVLSPTPVHPSLEHHPMSPVIDGMIGGSMYTKEPEAYPKASVNNQSTPQGFVRMEGRSVAVELVWLIAEKRLTYGQLFKLQRLAGQVSGQKLTDYVTYRSERLRQLPTNNDCYRYLKRFIDEKIDARYLCAERARRKECDARRDAARAQCDAIYAWAKPINGRVFASEGTGLAYRIHASSRTIEVVKAGVSTGTSLPLNRRFMDAVRDGKLVRTDEPKREFAGKSTPSQRVARSDHELRSADEALRGMKAILATSRIPGCPSGSHRVGRPWISGNVGTDA